MPHTIMEKKTEDYVKNGGSENNTNSMKEERVVKEKVVYKVVPVPYYYPVPVDAEWYYKHHEPSMRNGERNGERNGGFHGFPEDPAFDQFPFPPPPAHGFPGPPRSALRDSVYYSSSRDEDERYLRPVSPLYRNSSPSRGNHYASPPLPAERKQSKENGDARESRSEKEKEKSEAQHDTEEIMSPLSTSVKSEAHESENEDSAVNNKNGTESSKSDGENNKNGSESGDDTRQRTSSSDSEVSRKRRRFPMTFPYDQRKKNPKEGGEREREDSKGSNGHVEEISENPTEYKRSRGEETERGDRVYSSHKYSSNGSLSNGHYPYVMVPMRSPPYGDVGRSPRYSERSQVMYESRLYEDPYKEIGGEGRNKSMDEDDDKREIRYHPNGRRARTVFTRQQLLTLNNVFEKHPFVSGERMSELSDQLGLDRKIVKIWFQNKRQYARKKGSLVERNEEFYYDYQDRFNPSSAPPTMAERFEGR